MSNIIFNIKYKNVSQRENALAIHQSGGVAICRVLMMRFLAANRIQSDVSHPTPQHTDPVGRERNIYVRVLYI